MVLWIDIQFLNPALLKCTEGTKQQQAAEGKPEDDQRGIRHPPVDPIAEIGHVVI